jgi:hypothetical protein
MDLGPELADLTGTLLGTAVVDARPVPGGYTPALRRRLELADGRSVFLKAGLDPEMAIRLRREWVVYSQLIDSFMPRMLGWNEDPPVLLLEDLSRCTWVPPWTKAMVDEVLRTLRLVANLQPITGLERLGDSFTLGGWPQVQRDPSSFLSLGLCSASWLQGALPALVAASLPEYTHGDALLHLDVRSDNLCFRDGRAIIFDWDLATIGNPELDVAFWLPSLAAEGGPDPSSVADCRLEIVAIVAGFFAARAGLPKVPRGPLVREAQKAQLQRALPWAIEVLGLQPLDR